MMRTLVALWAVPMLLFWAWYFVSLNDWNMGYVLLTREAHDLIFRFYADMIGEVSLRLTGEALRIEPSALPAMLAKAFATDSLLLAALIAFRRRRAIGARLRGLRARYASSAVLSARRSL